MSVKEEILNYLAQFPNQKFEQKVLCGILKKDKGNFSKVIKQLREGNLINYKQGMGRSPSMLQHKVKDDTTQHNNITTQHTTQHNNTTKARTPLQQKMNNALKEARESGIKDDAKKQAKKAASQTVEQFDQIVPRKRVAKKQIATILDDIELKLPDYSEFYAYSEKSETIDEILLADKRKVKGTHSKINQARVDRIERYTHGILIGFIKDIINNIRKNILE